jgi:hypothetical protein
MMRPELCRHVVCPGNAAEVVKDHVAAMGGTAGRESAGQGVIEAFSELAKQNGWEW